MSALIYYFENNWLWFWIHLPIKPYTPINAQSQMTQKARNIQRVHFAILSSPTKNQSQAAASQYNLKCITHITTRRSRIGVARAYVDLIFSLLGSIILVCRFVRFVWRATNQSDARPIEKCTCISQAWCNHHSHESKCTTTREKRKELCGGAIREKVRVLRIGLCSRLLKGSFIWCAFTLWCCCRALFVN